MRTRRPTGCCAKAAEGIHQIKVAHVHVYCRVFTTSKTGITGQTCTSPRSTCLALTFFAAMKSAFAGPGCPWLSLANPRSVNANARVPYSGDFFSTPCEFDACVGKINKQNIINRGGGRVRCGCGWSGALFLRTHQVMLHTCALAASRSSTIATQSAILPVCLQVVGTKQCLIA